jgi:hypothetical protein
MAASYIRSVEKKEIISGDFLLAVLIAAGVVVGDFILRHLPV